VPVVESSLEKIMRMTGTDRDGNLPDGSIPF